MSWPDQTTPYQTFRIAHTAERAFAFHPTSSQHFRSRALILCAPRLSNYLLVDLIDSFAPSRLISLLISAMNRHFQVKNIVWGWNPAHFITFHANPGGAMGHHYLPFSFPFALARILSSSAFAYPRSRYFDISLLRMYQVVNPF